MNGSEFRRHAKRYAKKAGLSYQYQPGHGKGSHGRLYVGAHFTTIKRGEIQPGLYRAMLRQLRIKWEDY